MSAGGEDKRHSACKDNPNGRQRETRPSVPHKKGSGVRFFYRAQGTLRNQSSRRGLFRRNGGDDVRIDPWEKAADCERAIQAAADPQQKTILKNLRYLWIALANESECMSADEFAHESETIGRLHVALARARAPSLH